MPSTNSSRRADALLCVCNYPANTGYAWDFIESLYAAVTRRVDADGIPSFVSYPKIDSAPRTLRDCPAQPVVLDATLRSWRSIVDTITFVRRNRVRVIYFTDGQARSVVYPLLRLAGARYIIVHSHWSGPHARPRGLRRLMKMAFGRTVPADVIVTVSDYVATHHREAGQIPASRIVRVWNGMDVGSLPATDSRPLHRALGITPERKVVACACRASKQKGVPVLLRAFAQLLKDWPAGEPVPMLVYMGDGPEFGEIQRLRDASPVRDHILLTGYRTDAASLLTGADVCALPSIGADALPLAVMHPMALGRPVVASNVGGVPEMIVDGETGVLVPPADENALTVALRRLLLDTELAEKLGRAARVRIATLFTPAEQIDSLTRIVRRGFGLINDQRYAGRTSSESALSEVRPQSALAASDDRPAL